MHALARLLLLAAALAPPAAAQPMRAHLPRPDPVRPLHERLALADAAAIGTIREVELGRIHVDEATALLGEPGERFALKRAPSRPPPLRPGDRALLLLRGARSPYVLVDGPEETVTVAGAEAESQWRRAVVETLAALGQPVRLRDLYLGWLAGSDAGLRQAAQAGLASPNAPFAPLPDAIVAGLVRDATDPGLDSARRRAAARVALASPGGAGRLLPGLPGDAEGADAEIVSVALQVAALRPEPELGPLLARSLGHPREDVRRAALRLSVVAAHDPDARPALERMAAEDPIEELRESARRALERR